jgi:hypothetical protein
MTKQTKELTLAEKIDMIKMSVQALLQGYKMSRLITGTPGIGKSKAVIDELIATNTTYTHITGGIKDARALYTTLYKYNDPNIIVVFDDTNDIFKKKDCREILRAAVTNEAERKITFVDNKIILDGLQAVKPFMTFKSKVIIITNIPKNKIDQAILSRTSPIEIIVNKKQVAEFVELNLAEAPPSKVDIKWKEECFEFLMNEIGVSNMAHFDFRVFEDCMLWVCATKGTDKPDEWKKYVRTLVS